MPSSRIASAFSLGKGSSRDVLVATAVAGASGYVILAVAGTRLGSTGSLPFVTFWSALYFVVGALAGVQHEATRAARPAPFPAATRTRARNLFIVTAIGLVLLTLGTAFAWEPKVFPDDPGDLLAPLLLGSVGYLATAVTAGVLGGLASWRALAVITSADALLRLCAVMVALVFTQDTVVLAWCVAAPFGLIGLGAAAVFGRLARGHYSIDAGLRQLAWNTVRTVLSGAAMGVLITGFPALLRASAPLAEREFVASIVFVSSLVRSPLIVVAMALQPILVQRLRDSSRPSKTISQLLVVLGCTGAVLTVLAAWGGPWALRTLDAGYELSVGQFAILVGSAAPSAALFVTGAALLARGSHGLYVSGWALAAVTAVVIVFTAGDVMGSVIGAVIVAPLIGLTVHTVGLLRGRGPTGRA